MTAVAREATQIKSRPDTTPAGLGGPTRALGLPPVCSDKAVSLRANFQQKRVAIRNISDRLFHSKFYAMFV